MRLSTLRVRNLAVFALLASLIFASQVALMPLPGVQVVGMLIATVTVAYRVRALIPIYVFVALFILYYGFFTWNLPYLYIWLPLWGIFMLAPRIKLPAKIKAVFYAVLCGLFGLSFGALYAPAQALFFGFSFEQTVAWVIAGLPVDMVHAASNFASGLLILPLSDLLKKLESRPAMRGTM